MRLGAAKSAAGRAFQSVHLQVPGEDQEETRETFQFRVDKKKLQAAEWRDGHYLLRSNLPAGDPSVLWALLPAVDADRIGLSDLSRVNSAYAPFTINWSTAPTRTF
jgi:hypothetical protein